MVSLKYSRYRRQAQARPKSKEKSESCGYGTILRYTLASCSRSLPPEECRKTCMVMAYYPTRVYNYYDFTPNTLSGKIPRHRDYPRVTHLSHGHSACLTSVIPGRLLVVLRLSARERSNTGPRFSILNLGGRLSNPSSMAHWKR